MRRLLALVCSLACVLFIAAALAPPAAAQNPPPRDSAQNPPVGNTRPMAAQQPPGDYYAVSVTPDGGSEPTRPQNSGPYTTTFTVTNTGTLMDWFEISCGGQGPVSCSSVDPDMRKLSPGGSATVTATYSVGVGSSGSLTVWASGLYGDESDSGYRIVPVALPGPLPIVSLAPYSASLQDYSRCAAGCFAATYAQSTVPYYSMDTPRGVTLAYHGDRVKPRPFVHVNVTHGGDASNLPTAYRLKIKRGTTDLTFVNGETTLRFTTSTATVRLGAQIDALTSGISATGVYDITVVVGAEYAGGVSEVTANTTLIVVNEDDSPVARGWTLAGVQRLYTTSGGALVTDGSGSAVYYTYSYDTYTAPAGEFTRLSASGSGTGRTYTRAYPDSVKVKFDYLGRMTEIRDPWNNVTSFSYDGNGRPWQITDPVGKTIVLTYASYGLSSVGGFGPVTGVTVNSSRLLTAITDPDNVATQFGYDFSQRLSTITDRAGATTTLGYHTSGKVQSITAPLVAIYAGGQAHPVTTMAPWQVVSVPYGATSGTPFPSWRADTVRGTVTDPGGHTARFTVNAFGQPLTSAGPMLDTVTVTYNTAGQPLTVTDRLGVNSSYTYDATGFMTSATVAGLITNYHNGGWGLADSTWGAAPRRSIGIGANGRVNWTRLDDGSPTYYYYDSRGRDTLIAGPAGDLEVKRWYSDPLGSLSKDSVPGGRATTYGEDQYGRDTLVQRQAYPPWTVRYDALNRPTRALAIRALFMDDSTHYGYDSLRLRTVRDPKGQVWSFNYNALGWLTSRVDPVGRRDSLAYDIEGQLRRVINRRGQAVEITYDSLHRRVTRTGAAIAPDTLGYSPDGRVITASNSIAEEVTYLNGRLQADSVRNVFRAPGDPGRAYWRRYSYQAANGLLESVTATGPSLSLLSSGYAYRPTRWTLDSLRLGNVWTPFHFNNELAVDTVRFPGGFYVARGFVTADNLDQVSSQLMDYRYNRDTRGRIALAENHGANTVRAFGYDYSGQLEHVAYGVPIPGTCEDPADFGPSCQFTTDSSYNLFWDEVGNLDLRYGTQHQDAGVYGVGNRIQSYGECTYGTDDAGNVTWRNCPGQNVTFNWSADGLLTGYSISGGASVTLSYDAAGRVVRRDVNGVPVSYFLWDGGNLLAELDGSQNLVAQYSYYPGGLDHLHAFNRNGSVSYAQTDAEGNVRFLGTWLGNMVRSYEYDETGSLVGGMDPYGLNGIDRARWKGALLLAPDVGLYYMRARWYEPRTGRFMSEDPIGLAGGLNPYVFAGNDPINGSDPAGMRDCVDGESSHWHPAHEVVSGGWAPTLTYVEASYHDCTRDAGRPVVPHEGGGSPVDAPYAPETLRRMFQTEPAAQESPPELPDDDCTKAEFALAMTAVSDLAFIGTLTVAGYGAWVARGVHLKALRIGNVLGYAEAAIGIHGEYRARRGAAAAIARYAMTSEASSSPAVVVTSAELTGSISIWDFVPVVGSIRAYQAAKRACGW